MGLIGLASAGAKTCDPKKKKKKKEKKKKEVMMTGQNINGREGAHGNGLRGDTGLESQFVQEADSLEKGLNLHGTQKRVVLNNFTLVHNHVLYRGDRAPLNRDPSQICQRKEKGYFGTCRRIAGSQQSRATPGRPPR